MDAKKFWKEAKTISDEETFKRLAIELFHYQIMHVPVYKQFLNLLNFNPDSVAEITDIPFLPVQLFKSHSVTDQKITPEFYFTSSGTTGQITSRHYVADKEIYDESLLEGFRIFYGDPAQYCFLALLPSYLERSGSSLVYMVDVLIRESKHPDSGFYLHNLGQLHDKLILLQKNQTRIFLLGVTYALLDLFEAYPTNLQRTVIMETGGMKGRRKELVRAELHEVLSEQSGVAHIHSEYGMTELFSQAYSHQKGFFKCPPWMRALIYDLHDPFTSISQGLTGTINVIDLANIHSCAFIATQDLGRITPSGEFEVLGRMDSSELRGCNLMIA